MIGEPKFLVDPAHPGRSEAEWKASRPLAALGALILPACQRAVVVAPHPDDEILGAGGLLQVLAGRGVPLQVCAVTDGEASWGALGGEDGAALRRIRTAESEQALCRLGLGGIPRARLGLPDGQVAGYAAVLSAWLEQHLSIDSLCIAPWSADGHPDHDAAGHVALLAAGAVGAAYLRYPVWAWHWADPVGTDLPWAACRRLEMTRRQRARKRWATGAFRSQTTSPDDFVVSGGGTSLPVLPPAVLRRFWRSFEVFIQ